MAYDHSKKIGNEGDLVKHSVLHACVNHVLDTDTSQPPKAFKYVEAHCGRPVYVLPEFGEWRRGIGDFSGQNWGCLKAVEKEARSFLVDFFETHLSSNIGVGQAYFGSSAIVFRILRDRWHSESLDKEDAQYSLDLYDTNVHVCDDLNRYYMPITDRVNVRTSNGYAAVLGLQRDRASLVLIDPPDRNFDDVVEAVLHLQAEGIPYICWTTRFSEQGNAIEHDDSKLDQRLPDSFHVSVRWMEPTGSSQSPFGCRLTVPDKLSQVAETVIDQLVSIMPERKMSSPRQRANESDEAFEHRKSLERKRKWEKV